MVVLTAGCDRMKRRAFAAGSIPREEVLEFLHAGDGVAEVLGQVFGTPVGVGEPGFESHFAARGCLHRVGRGRLRRCSAPGTPGEFIFGG